MATDPKNILAVQEWPVPENTKQVRGFLGLAGYYRKFVRHFGLISRPLTDLLRKNVVFAWTSDKEDAFQALKHALISAPVLAMPDFTQEFEIETYASEKGIGAVLMQNKHPIAYLSKALGPRAQGLSTYEKEGFAILLAVEHWRTYLQPRDFIIRTDRRSLAHLGDQRLTTVWQQKVMTKLLGLQYKIMYKSGLTNRAADALSLREKGADMEVVAVSTIIPDWMEAIVKGYQQDPQTSKIVHNLMISGNGTSKFQLNNGILRLGDRVWVGNNVTVQQNILNSLHSSAIGGHSGFQVTYHRIRKFFCLVQNEKGCEGICGTLLSL